MCNTSNNNKTLSCLAAAVLIGAGFAMTSNAATVKNFAELSNAIVAKDANIVIAAPIAISGALPAIDFATTISGNYDDTTVIDGGGQYAGFTINAGANVTIKGITIRNTKSGVTNDGKVHHGAAINNSGILAIDSCHFENNVVDIAEAMLNRVARAGAILSEVGSILDLQNSSFFGNSVKGANGYLLPDGQAVVNTVGEGGAVYIAGTAKIWNCTFSGNIAKAVTVSQI